MEYIVYLERRGIENGNHAGLRQLLRIFRALVNYAKDELHMYGANPAIFEATAEKMTWDMINEKEGMIVYERTKFPKLAKPLLIDRIVFLPIYGIFLIFQSDMSYLGIFAEIIYE